MQHSSSPAPAPASSIQLALKRVGKAIATVAWATLPIATPLVEKEGSH